MRPILYKLNEEGTEVPMKSGEKDEVLRWDVTWRATTTWWLSAVCSSTHQSPFPLRSMRAIIQLRKHVAKAPRHHSNRPSLCVLAVNSELAQLFTIAEFRMNEDGFLGLCRNLHNR
jgi:hypothetical protein